MTLRELRDSRDLTQARLAELSGVSQTYISELELGKKQPTVLILRKLAKALGVPPSRLLDDTEDEMAATVEQTLSARA